MINLPVVEGRSCDECTKCCEGYLKSEDIRGHEVTLGKPCFFVEIGKGCTDYDNRPDHPCKKFQCEWLIDKNIPENFKPSNSNVIFTKIFENGIEYTNVIEAGGKLDSEILTWIIDDAITNDKNYSWNILGNMYWFGDDEFDEMMNFKFPQTPAVDLNQLPKFETNFDLTFEDE